MPGWTSAYVEVHTLDGGHSDTVNYLSFSSDGTYLVLNLLYIMDCMCALGAMGTASYDKI